MGLKSRRLRRSADRITGALLEQQAHLRLNVPGEPSFAGFLGLSQSDTRPTIRCDHK
jgi:hypothetical protein